MLSKWTMQQLVEMDSNWELNSDQALGFSTDVQSHGCQSQQESAGTFSLTSLCITPGLQEWGQTVLQSPVGVRKKSESQSPFPLISLSSPPGMLSSKSSLHVCWHCCLNLLPMLPAQGQTKHPHFTCTPGMQFGHFSFSLGRVCG